MSKKIHLGGDEDDFLQSLADRLSRAGATLVDSSEDAEYVIHFGQEGDGNMVILTPDQKISRQFRGRNSRSSISRGNSGIGG